MLTKPIPIAIDFKDRHRVSAHVVKGRLLTPKQLNMMHITGNIRVKREGKEYIVIYN